MDLRAIKIEGTGRPSFMSANIRVNVFRRLRPQQFVQGDIGYIDDVDFNAGAVIASFDGWSVTYGFRELDMLVPAYATTIHKSQGSEYPAVIRY
jgi:ATP-dependent exoDNAse (exonuclease V) alpha subunit